jgi:undecaprenyl-diphosphatase
MHIRRLLSRPGLMTRRTVVISLLYLTGALFFVSIYDGVRESGDLATFDKPLLAWAISHQNEQLSLIMRVLTDLLSPVAISVFTLVGAGVWMWRKKEYWRPMVVVSSVMLAFILAAIIKTFTARARPTLTDLLEAPAAISYSFPSGHTIGTAVLLLVLSYFVCTTALTLRRFIACALTSGILIALVAFSRVYLGYHWLTDVSASVGLALIILAAAMTVDTYWQRRRSKRFTSKAV